MDVFYGVAANITSIYNLLVIASGVLIGIIIGALPGLGPVMVIAIFLPFTYYMDAMIAISFLVGIYTGGIYGGSISAILINVPGTSAAAATLLDGYPMTLKGQWGKALHASLTVSIFGGVFSGIALCIAAPQLARFSLRFGPIQFFGIIVFALTIIAGVSQGALLKGISAAAIGILLSTVGTDPFQGNLRFTFGIYQLYGGITFVALLIGIFGLAEILIQAETKIEKERDLYLKPAKSFEDKIFTLKEMFIYKVLIIKSALIGLFIGMLPGIGASIAPFIAYAEAKRTSKDPNKFGKGNIQGVIAAETANNAVTGGALVPLLTLGIPGDAVTAVLYGALMIHGLMPGPLLFEKQAILVFSIFAFFFISHIFIYIFGKLILRYGTSYIINISKAHLFTVIIILCVVGAFATQNHLFDVLIMIIAGILGYILRKFDFPIAPLIIAFILGSKLEMSLRQSLVLCDDNWVLFLMNPWLITFLLFSIISTVFFLIHDKKAKQAIKVSGGGGQNM